MTFQCIGCKGHKVLALMLALFSVTVAFCLAFESIVPLIQGCIDRFCLMMPAACASHIERQYNTQALKRIKHEPPSADWKGFVENTIESEGESRAQTLAEACDTALAETEWWLL